MQKDSSNTDCLESKLKKSDSNYLKHQRSKILSAEPLWQRVPTRDSNGKPYSDFMMLIPCLRKLEPTKITEIINKVEAVLQHYENDIVLADLNLKINVLWITIKPHLGLTAEIASLIHHVVPEAKLVSQHKVS